MSLFFLPIEHIAIISTLMMDLLAMLSWIPGILLEFCDQVCPDSNLDLDKILHKKLIASLKKMVCNLKL